MLQRSRHTHHTPMPPTHNIGTMADTPPPPDEGHKATQTNQPGFPDAATDVIVTAHHGGAAISAPTPSTSKRPRTVQLSSLLGLMPLPHLLLLPLLSAKHHGPSWAN